MIAITLVFMTNIMDYIILRPDILRVLTYPRPQGFAVDVAVCLLSTLLFDHPVFSLASLPGRERLLLFTLVYSALVRQPTLAGSRPFVTNR